jgi:hypothetical protein
MHLFGPFFGSAIDFGAAGLGLRKRPFCGRNKFLLRPVRWRLLAGGTAWDGIAWRSLRHSDEEANSLANVKAVNALSKMCYTLAVSWYL